MANWKHISINNSESESYRIYKSGRVYSEKSNKWLKTTELNSRGYRIVHLSVNGIPKQYFLHRILANAFVERTYKDSKYNRNLVHFKDFNIKNLSITNLEFVNQTELYMKKNIRQYPNKFITLSDYSKYISILVKLNYDNQDIIKVLNLNATRYTILFINKIRKNKI